MTYRILTVCLGNICRSPAAEAVIREQARAAGLDVEVESAGTAAYHVGESPHHQSIEAGTARGYVVGGRARRFEPDDFHRFDLIVTMDSENLENVLRMAPSDSDALVKPLMDYAGGGDVPDPWGKPLAAYERMYDLIEAAAAGLVASLAESGQSSGLRQAKDN
jgi:protein-tyrosine phosphatase